MVGSHAVRANGCGFAAAIAAACLTMQGPSLAQSPSLPVATPTQGAPGIVGPGAPPAAAPIATVIPQPAFDPGTAPLPTRVVTGPLDTITESLFGQPDPDTWRPLMFSTLLSEGWDEVWVPSPSGSGGAPRQGWINAADGNLYRLNFFTFAQGFNREPKGNAYLGAYTIFAPLSRRLDLIVNVPFVLRNNAVTGLPFIDPSLPGTRQTPKSHTGFGDLSFTPRVLLHETKDFSLTAEMAVITPTGTQPLAGNTTTLVPAVAFWNNVSGGLVVRGGLGLAIPMNGTSDNLIGQFAVGNTFTAHDTPLFGDFTLYLSTVVNTPLSNGDNTSVTLTPGLRTHVGQDWYFLAGLPTPVTNARVADEGMIFWFMKAW